VLIGSAAWLCLLQMRLTSPDVKPVLSPVVDTTPLVRRTSSWMAAIAPVSPRSIYGHRYFSAIMQAHPLLLLGVELRIATAKSSHRQKRRQR
jgi:hypothetical protein